MRPDTVLWRIYYSDGSTYDNLDGPPEGAPRDGALVVGQVGATHNWDCSPGDWFVYRSDEGRWYNADLPGLFDHIKFFTPHVRAVIQGRYVTNELWYKIWKSAAHDERLPTPTVAMHD